MFGFDIDFVTHWDFHQTYTDKITSLVKPPEDSIKAQKMKLISEMALLLTKMCMQNADYCNLSPSVVVISSFYAATAFLKHSNKYGGTETNIFIAEIRKHIFSILTAE